MDDYHVFSMDDVDGEVTDHGVALTLAEVPWSTKQLWAPDVAFKNGKYFSISRRVIMKEFFGLAWG